MGKINNNNSNKQVQTELFSLVEPSKKVEVGFTSTEVSSFEEGAGSDNVTEAKCTIIFLIAQYFPYFCTANY